MFEILLCGVGNIGRRYLEGLARLEDVVIDILDPSDLNFEAAISVTPKRVKLRRVTDVDLKTRYDLAIISTPAMGRANLVSQINNKSIIRFWILEKFLAQSLKGIFEIQALRRSNSWVNTPRRITTAYNKIKELAEDEIREISICYPGLDLGCNAIHYIDVCSWLGSSRVEEIEVRSSSGWYPAKRLGYFMFDGIVDVYFENGTKLAINNSEDADVSGIKFITPKKTIHYEEISGDLSYGSTLLNVKIEKQSEITPLIVFDLMNTNDCKLPRLEESIAQHIAFLNGLARDDRLRREDEIYPIT